MKSELKRLKKRNGFARFTLRDDKFTVLIAQVVGIGREDSDDEYNGEDCVTLGIGENGGELLFIAIKDIFSFKAAVN